MQEICQQTSQGARHHDGPARPHQLGRRRQRLLFHVTLELIERAARFIEKKYADKGGDAAAFGGPNPRRLARSRCAAKSLRGSCRGCAARSAAERRFIGTVQDDEKILRFVNSKDAARLAELGTSCPDHFLRTKIKPLYVPLEPGRVGDLDRSDDGSQNSSPTQTETHDGLEKYREDYAAYYDRCKRPELARDARPEPDRHAHPRPRHDRLGQGQERIARHRRVLQLRRRSDARRRSDRPIHRAAAAGSVRHRVLAARGGEAAGACRRKRNWRARSSSSSAPAAASARKSRIGWSRKARTSSAST